MFAPFKHLGLCVGNTATRSSIDRIRADYNSEVLNWKSASEEYTVGLSNTQDTIPNCSLEVTDIYEDVRIIDVRQKGSN